MLLTMNTSNLLRTGTSSEYIIPEGSSPIRLDKYITSQLSSYSRSFLQKLITTQGVTVNGILTKKLSYIVRSGDIIRIDIPSNIYPDYSSPLHEYDFGIKVLYMHEHFLVIAKPAHLVVHAPNLFSTEPTVVDWILKNFKDIARVGIADRPGIVHRLDKQSSGILIIPRTNYGHSYFGTLFRERTIHKTYYAVVQGKPQQSGTIDLPIGRDPVTKSRMTANLTNMPIHMRPMHMRESLTHYKVIEYFDNAALVEIKPVTGRTHQIRVHFAAIGHPLIGDTLYGKQSALIARQALHAWSISFAFNEHEYTISCDLPEDFKQLLTSLRTTITDAKNKKN